MDPQLVGNPWDDHGRYFVGAQVAWKMGVSLDAYEPEFEKGFEFKSRFGLGATEKCMMLISQILRNAQHTLTGTNFRRLLADRDIHPERPDPSLALWPNGSGATNVIRRFIHTSDERLSRALIQKTLLEALNKIFGSDGQFTEVQAKEHDLPINGRPQGTWEIYLGEKRKDLIPLSNSGSGLKTVILVLLNLLVCPKLADRRQSDCVFAFEELENNLHPAILRRLFRFLEEFAVKEKSTIFLTTHSSVALDLFAPSPNAQIIHVKHDGESATAKTISAHFDHLGVISELGAKPSDLLQANGIIWVEGPSDCIYLNRWIHLMSGGKFREGRDYQCAFYAGALLARTQFASPEEADKELVNLFRINPNIIVVCDGDQTRSDTPVKDRVGRIRDEVGNIPDAHIWITGAKEIENYIPGKIFAEVMGAEPSADPEQYEPFFPKQGNPGTSYFERCLKQTTFDKMDLAALCAPKMDLEMMTSRFDWKEQMEKIVERIERWNA